MALKDILAISGKGGLFKFVSQGRNGIIVESLIDNKRTNVPATAKISALEDIAIFTETEEVSLKDVFKKIQEKENGGKAVDPKSEGQSLKDYMAEILPDYDKERVYVSDLKKLFTWYNALQELDMLNLEDEEETKEESGKEKETEEKEPTPSNKKKAKESKEKSKEDENK